MQSVRISPEPGPATIITGPSVVRAASPWTGFSPPSNSSATSGVTAGADRASDGVRTSSFRQRVRFRATYRHDARPGCGTDPAACRFPHTILIFSTHMSLDIGPDRSLALDVSRDQDATQTATSIDPGIAALQQVTNAAVTQAYGRENADVAGARLEELGQFDRERAVETVRDRPETLGPVQDPAAASRLAEALPVVYASTDIARPPVTAETLERDGVTYAVQGLDRVRDDQGTTRLVGQSNEQAVAYVDRERGFPYTFHVRAFHPDSTFGGGFDGDNRGFSTSLDVTSRIQQEITLNTSTDQISQRSWSDQSVYKDPTGLTDRALRRTAVPESGVSDYRLNNANEAVETHTFNTSVQGNNPLVPGSPNIDVDGRFTVTEDLARGQLRVQAQFNGDNFPNSESFVTDSRGVAVSIAAGTLAGTPFSLVGEHADRPIMNADLIIKLDGQGNFTGVTSGGRDYTIAQWNAQVQQNPQ